MKISLITTAKNESQYASTLIQAILSQTRQPDEWVVVDGGSVDSTVKKFKAVALCTVIEQNCNRACGRNLAISRACGEIIAVTDVGCVPGATWLEELTAGVDLDKRQIAAGQTICRVECPFDAAQHVLMDQFVYKSLKYRTPAASCRSLAFHRLAWQEHPFPEWLDVGEDTSLLIKWRQNGWSIHFVRGADMEWIPQQSFRAFVEQYFNYIRGEGQSATHTKRHLLRIFFYLLLIVLFFSGGSNLSALSLSCLIWLAYLLVTTLRLAGIATEKSLSFRIMTLLWIFPALVAMDAAKTAGFIVGSIERVILPKLKKKI